MKHECDYCKKIIRGVYFRMKIDAYRCEKKLIPTWLIGMHPDGFIGINNVCKECFYKICDHKSSIRNKEVKP